LATEKKKFYENQSEKQNQFINIIYLVQIIVELATGKKTFCKNQSEKPNQFINIWCK
jgi:hypothetical protein